MGLFALTVAPCLVNGSTPRVGVGHYVTVARMRSTIFLTARTSSTNTQVQQHLQALATRSPQGTEKEFAGACRDYTWRRSRRIGRPRALPPTAWARSFEAD